MEPDIKLIDYSEKAVAIKAEYDCALQDEFKLIGGRFNSRLSFGAGWIFSRKKHEDNLRGLFDCYGLSVASVTLSDMGVNSDKTDTDSDGKTETPEYILTDKERKEWAQNTGYDSKYYNVAIRLSGGEIVAISKPELKTEFWHHDEGAGYDENCRITKTAKTKRDYFIGENTNDFRELIADFISPGTGDNYYNHLWLGNWNKDGRNRWQLKWLNISPESTNCREAIGWHDSQLQSMYDKGQFKPLSDDDRARLLTGYKIALEAIEKRCNAWLKRYGEDKLSFRTYWADR